MSPYNENQNPELTGEQQAEIDRQRFLMHKRIGGRIVDVFAAVEKKRIETNAVADAPEALPPGTCGTCRNGRLVSLKAGGAFPVAWPASVTPPVAGNWVQCQVKIEKWKYHSESAPCALGVGAYVPQ